VDVTFAVMGKRTISLTACWNLTTSEILH